MKRLRFLTHYVFGKEESQDVNKILLVVVVVKEETSLAPPRDSHPNTGQRAFIHHLANNLKQLLKDNAKAVADLNKQNVGSGEILEEEANSMSYLEGQISRLQEFLQSMSDRLMDIPQSRIDDLDVKDAIQSITNLGYEIEYAIDSAFVSERPLYVCKFWLRHLLKEFQLTDRKTNDIECKIDMDAILANLLFHPSPDLYVIPILEKRRELDIIPFVDNYGMPTHVVSTSEIGSKLHEIFSHHDIIRSFQVRTWGSVSSYKERKRNVFLQLLPNVSHHPCAREVIRAEYSSDMSIDELQSSLYSILNARFKYLVILEDMRDIDTLRDIARALPNRYARILVTTPSPKLANECGFFSGEDIPHKMAVVSSTSQTNKPPAAENDVVGFVEDTQLMLQRLIGESERLCIISIVGMAGQGKTTLAMKLFNDLLVVEYFHVRVSCNVSQAYQKRGLLLELLGQVVQLSNIILDKNDEELAEMLFKNLKGRRFLVLLDDMWTVDAWDNLRRCFPDDNNGSKIVFTTRIQELASKAKSEQLSRLSDDESLELLKKKVFRKENCPQQLLAVGKRIAKGCNGLPLSVVLVAGFLEKMVRTADKWEEIEDTLSSCILGDVGAHGRSIIEMSYKYVPDHLRPCFLYFGVFLEDREISASKLIRLWIAEGFIQCTPWKSSEEVAGDYLMELVGRSLVTVAQENSSGGIKLCRVHDLLHEFCLAKAREENFLQQINDDDEHFPSSTLRRLCIHLKTDQSVLLNLGAATKFVRSLLFIAWSDFSTSYSYDISSIFHNLKFITILDLEDIKVGGSVEEIGVLLLRYLALQCFKTSIPSSIRNLLNLESFLFKGLTDEVVKVPNFIWDMKKLRLLHIKNSASFDSVPIDPDTSPVPHNLHTFSTPSLTYGDDMEKVLQRLSSI